jgi:hypothetical protein
MRRIGSASAKSERDVAEQVSLDTQIRVFEVLRFWGWQRWPMSWLRMSLLSELHAAPPNGFKSEWHQAAVRDTLAALPDTDDIVLENPLATDVWNSQFQRCITGLIGSDVWKEWPDEVIRDKAAKRVCECLRGLDDRRITGFITWASVGESRANLRQILAQVVRAGTIVLAAQEIPLPVATDQGGPTDDAGEAESWRS